MIFAAGHFGERSEKIIVLNSYMDRVILSGVLPFLYCEEQVQILCSCFDLYLNHQRLLLDIRSDFYSLVNYHANREIALEQARDLDRFLESVNRETPGISPFADSFDFDLFLERVADVFADPEVESD